MNEIARRLFSHSNFYCQLKHIWYIPSKIIDILYFQIHTFCTADFEDIYSFYVFLFFFLFLQNENKKAETEESANVPQVATIEETLKTSRSFSRCYFHTKTFTKYCIVQKKKKINDLIHSIFSLSLPKQKLCIGIVFILYSHSCYTYHRK